MTGIARRMVLAAGLLAVTAAHAAEYKATVYLTAKDTDARLKKVAEPKAADLPQPTEMERVIFIDPAATFQTVVGIGGALTDAAAETYAKLPAEKQKELIRAYFDPKEGLGYSLARTHIHSCDFSSESYTYVDDNDASLESFDIQHDLKYRIPFIKAAMEAAGKDFVIYASPWSPPAWMKTNNDMLQGGKLKPEFADAWAQYYVRFIKAYEAQGIPIWGLTVQNEPMAIQRWESCIFTAQEERDFVKNHLGPTLKKAGMGDRKLIVWDHNRGLLYHRAAVILGDPDAAKYVWGVGFHWYLGDQFENVSLVKKRFPDKNLVFTEGCAETFKPDQINDWQWGETYGRSLIHDFNNGVVAWTDWNVLLDQRGGPNHVENFCFAPVHANTETGEITYLNSFYYLGHFSKFVRPGAKRIVASTMWDELLTTAFVNPDGSVVAIIMNPTKEDRTIKLWLDEKVYETESPHHSMVTAVLEKK